MKAPRRAAARLSAKHESEQDGNGVGDDQWPPKEHPDRAKQLCGLCLDAALVRYGGSKVTEATPKRGTGSTVSTSNRR